MKPDPPRLPPLPPLPSGTPPRPRSAGGRTLAAARPVTSSQATASERPPDWQPALQASGPPRPALPAVAEQPQQPQQPEPSGTPGGMPPQSSLAEPARQRLSPGLPGPCAGPRRHGHQALPTEREHLASWLGDCSPAQCRLQSALAAARDTRACLFLRFHSLASLRRVQCQQGTPWFPAALLYEIDRQITRSTVIALCAPPVNTMEGACRGTFSPCGRWLYVTDTSGFCTTRLLHWNPRCRWDVQLELTIRPSCVLFDTRVQGCSFYGYASGMLTCWEGSTSGGQGFQSSPAADVPDARVRKLFLTADARHLVVLCDKPRLPAPGHTPGEADLLLILERTCVEPGRQTWRAAVGLEYLPRYPLTDMAVSPSRSQMVLCSRDSQQQEASDLLALWCATSRAQAESGWRRSRVGYAGGVVLRLIYSPDGNLLLVLLKGGLAPLWRVGPQVDTLLPLAVVDCRVHEGERLAPLPLTPESRSEVYGKWQPFSGNSRQLAVPVSPVAVQMWRWRDQDWQPAERIELLSGQQAVGETGQDEAHYVLLSDNGRVLVLASLQRLTVWYHRQPGGWQPQCVFADEGAISRQGLASQDALLLGSCSTHCLVATGVCGELAIYGPDSEDHFRRKAYQVVGLPVRRLVASPDGLSVVAQTLSGLLTFWQLMLPPEGPERDHIASLM